LFGRFANYIPLFQFEGRAMNSVSNNLSSPSLVYYSNCASKMYKLITLLNGRLHFKHPTIFPRHIMVNSWESLKA
jgi:hypothetical protein